jgi:hypothetical protein
MLRYPLRHYLFFACPRRYPFFFSTHRRGTAMSRRAGIHHHDRRPLFPSPADAIFAAAIYRHATPRFRRHIQSRHSHHAIVAIAVRRRRAHADFHIRLFAISLLTLYIIRHRYHCSPELLPLPPVILSRLPPPFALMALHIFRQIISPAHELYSVARQRQGWAGVWRRWRALLAASALLQQKGAWFGHVAIVAER